MNFSFFNLSLNPWGLYTSEKFAFSPATIMNQNVPRTINYNAMLKCIPYISQSRFGQLRLRSLVMFLIEKEKKKTF